MTTKTEAEATRDAALNLAWVRCCAAIAKARTDWAKTKTKAAAVAKAKAAKVEAEAEAAFCEAEDAANIACDAEDKIAYAVYDAAIADYTSVDAG